MAHKTTFERRKNANEKNFSFKDTDGQFIFPSTPTILQGVQHKN